MKINIF